MIDISTKIKLACTYRHISLAELSRRLGTSAQALNQRMRTGKFTSSELQKIAESIGANIEVNFVFDDGNKI